MIRAKANMQFRRVHSQTVDLRTGLRCDQTIILTGPLTSTLYPDRLRRVKIYDAEHDTMIVLLTNNFILPAKTITELYRCRWQIELFFKWIKQHLRIKVFYGISENAVKTQIWIAISVYLIVAIIKKRLAVDASLNAMLQVLSLNLFEKTNLCDLFAGLAIEEESTLATNQLNLF